MEVLIGLSLLGLYLAGIYLFFRFYGSFYLIFVACCLVIWGLFYLCVVKLYERYNWDVALPIVLLIVMSGMSFGVFYFSRIAIEKSNLRGADMHQLALYESATMKLAEELDADMMDVKSTSREEELRTFVLKESPTLWKTYQELQAELAEQTQKIEKLRETFIDFGRDPVSDLNLNSICATRDEMSETLQKLYLKIEDLFLASKKYEAMLSKSEYDSLRKRLMEDGIQAAEDAKNKFNEMRMNK